MLTELHTAVQRLVHECGRVPASDVDVRFDPPRREWVTSLTRPTLSFFLFDVRENTELRQANLEASRGNGHTTYRVPPRRFDLRYMVSALTTVIEDEHLLLWRALVTLLRYPTFPDEVLSAELRALDAPLSAQIDKPEEEGTLLDVWSGLDTPPRPALLYTVTAPVELELSRMSPLVLTRTARYTRMLAGGDQPWEERTHIGGRVLDAGGRAIAGALVSVEGKATEGALTNSEGEFTLPGVPAGAVTLRVARAGESPTLVKIEIPSASYDIVL